ncbi:MAG TPA: NUDIX domain-containing protein [Thermoanaerobaculia bacterium]|nr:NUDIX domain-containing protein [Thermoanaerobaculia bacterium]
MSEEVMVVPRADLEPFIGGRGFDLIRAGTSTILELIESRHLFIPRPQAEVSPEFKQIIPYVAIRNGEDYFLLKRTARQTETRLHHKLSLGIGGHINPDTPTLLGGLKRELEEEVALATPYELHFVGILNDDTTDVGRVHLGAVYVLDAAARNITVRETEKMSGSWVAREDLGELRETMETWSQLVYDHYVTR